MKNFDLFWFEYLNGLELSLAFFSKTGATLASLIIFFLSFVREDLFFLINIEPLVCSSTDSSDCWLLSVVSSTEGCLVATFSLVTFTRVEAEEEEGRLYLQHLWKENSLQLNFSFRQKGGIFCSVVVVVVVVAAVVVISVVATVVVLSSTVDSICNEMKYKTEDKYFLYRFNWFSIRLNNNLVDIRGYLYQFVWTALSLLCLIPNLQ